MYYGMYYIGEREERAKNVATFNCLQKLAEKSQRQRIKVVRAKVKEVKAKIVKAAKIKGKRPKKVYRTNRDTISLNLDEFCLGWMRPRDSSFDPRLVVGVGLREKGRKR